MAQTNSTRRRFLQGVASATVAGAAVSRMAAASYARVIGANDRINLALIGCGGRGRGILKDMVKPANANSPLVAVCDIWKQRLEKYPSEAEGVFGARPRAYADYHKVLEDADVDAVVIATPDHQHAGQTIDAVQAGKHVYVEKPISPLACDLDELNRLADTVKASKMVVQNGTHGVSCPAVRAVKQFIAEKRLGKLFRVEGSEHYPVPYWVNYRGPTRPEDTDWKAFLYNRKDRPFDAHQHASWMGYHDYTSGAIGGWMSHFSNTVHFVTECGYPTTASAWGGRYAPANDPRCDAPDQVTVVIEYPDGFHTHFVSRFGSSIYDETIIFYFEKGVLRCRFGHHIGNPTYSSEGVNDEIKPAKLLDFEPPYPGQAHVENWFKCIREGGQPNANMDYGYKQGLVVVMGDAAYSTARKVVFDRDKRQVRPA